jgi:trimeric autotransporter adhesin
MSIRLFHRTLLVAAMSGALVLVGAITPAQAAYSENPSFSWVPNRPVYSMARDGNVIYIGGTFSTLTNPSTGQRVNRNRLAALDANTGQLLAWNPGANEVVRALATGPDGTVYVGGDFTNVAGRGTDSIAAVTPGGDPKPGWSATVNGTVRQIRTDGSDVYVAGNFGRVNNTSRPGIAKIAATDGDLDASWNARVGGGRVRALTHGPDGTMLVGGSFTSLSGQSRIFLGQVSRATGAVTGWRPQHVCDSCQLLDLDTDGRLVFAAVGGGGGGRAASWSVDGTNRRWVRQGDGDTQSIAVADDGIVYAGGHFGPRFLNATRHQLVALTAASGALLSFSPRMQGNDHPGVWDLIADGNQLHVAGGFVMDGDPAARYGRFPAL